MPNGKLPRPIAPRASSSPGLMLDQGVVTGTDTICPCILKCAVDCVFLLALIVVEQDATQR